MPSLNRDYIESICSIICKIIDARLYNNIDLDKSGGDSVHIEGKFHERLNDSITSWCMYVS